MTEFQATLPFDLTQAWREVRAAIENDVAVVYALLDMMGVQEPET